MPFQESHIIIHSGVATNTPLTPFRYGVLTEYPEKLGGQIDVALSTPRGAGISWAGSPIKSKGRVVRLFIYSESVPAVTIKRDLIVTVADGPWQDALQTPIDAHPGDEAALQQALEQTATTADADFSRIYVTDLNRQLALGKKGQEMFTILAWLKRYANPGDVAWRVFAVDKNGKRTPLHLFAANYTRNGGIVDGHAPVGLYQFQFPVSKKDAGSIAALVLQEWGKTHVLFENIALKSRVTAK